VPGVIRRCAAVLLFCVLLSACGTPDPVSNFRGNNTCSTTAKSSEGATTKAFDPKPPTTNGDAVGEAVDEMPHDHIVPPAKVKYEHNPPTSGCHYSLGAQGGAPAPITAGAYGNDPEIAPEFWLHNLEHGYVAVLYNCPQSCPSDLQALRTWLKKLPADPAAQSCAQPVPYAKVIVIPWKSMKKKFAAVSWDWYDGMDTLNLDEVQKFYDSHNGQSPEGVCTP